MADVIFNGTDGRKAIGMAEVSMTFADVDPKTLSLPGVNLEFLRDHHHPPRLP